MRDHYGRRHDRFGVQARSIVAQGLERGLGRDDILRDLKEAAETILAGKGSPYWDVVAGSFVGRGRTYAQFSSYAEAGIHRYRFEAVRDEATTEICNVLHGTEFSVDRGIELFERVDANPGGIKDISPWVRDGFDEQGRRIMYVRPPSGGMTRIGVVATRATGTRDGRGVYNGLLSSEKLQEIGAFYPPLHGL